MTLHCFKMAQVRGHPPLHLGGFDKGIPQYAFTLLWIALHYTYTFRKKADHLEFVQPHSFEQQNFLSLQEGCGRYERFFLTPVTVT
jgi:hypothetical protein